MVDIEKSVSGSEYPEAPVPVYSPDDVMRRVPNRPLMSYEYEAVGKIKVMGQEFYDLLSTLPQSREVSLAKTKIEEAVMWATKGVTR